MFDELNNAIAVLTVNQNNNFSAKCDKVYSGNVVHWIKFANSLKLRMAIRLANVDAAMAQKEAEEAVNHSIGTMTSNDDNAYMTVSSINPYKVIMYDYNNGDSHVSADIISYMNGYSDPRRPLYFTRSTFDDSCGQWLYRTAFGHPDTGREAPSNNIPTWSYHPTPKYCG
jgi:hypothetical protein